MNWCSGCRGRLLEAFDAAEAFEAGALGALGPADDALKHCGKQEKVANEGREESGACESAEEDDGREGACHGREEGAADNGGGEEQGKTHGFEGPFDGEVNVGALFSFAQEANEKVNGVVHGNSEADAEGKHTGDLERFVEVVEDACVEEKGKGVGDDAEESEGQGAQGDRENNEHSNGGEGEAADEITNDVGHVLCGDDGGAGHMKGNSRIAGLEAVEVGLETGEGAKSAP